MKKSLALVARKKLVAYRKSSTAHSTAAAKVKHDDDMEKTRLAAKVKPKPKAKEVTLKHRGHANQKVHNPKGGLGERASAATAAYRSKVASVGKKLKPYAQAATAGALQAGGSVAAGEGMSKLLNFRSGNKGALVGLAAFSAGRQATLAGTALGNKLQSNRKFSPKMKKRLERVQTWTRRGVTAANFARKYGRTAVKVGRAAYRGYQRARTYRQQQGMPRGDFEATWRDSSSSSSAVQLLLGKELETLVTAFKARKQASYDQLREAAIQTFRAAYPYTEGGTYRYVCEVYPDYMIVDEGGKYYKAGYSDDGVAAHGEWEEVARVTGWEAKELRAGLEVFKDKDDSYRWVLLSSNGFRDRDGEIVSTKALEHDVALWDLQDGPPDPLRFWHVALDDDHKNGLDLGYTDFRMVHNHTLIESGGFIDPVVGKAVHDAQDKLAASIGFRHSPKEPDSDKIFNTVRIFERSLLPKESASNLLTHLVVTDQETNNA